VGEGVARSGRLGCISIEHRKERIDTDWYKSIIGESRGNFSERKGFLDSAVCSVKTL
jgi:hypothetical protein